MPEIDPTSFALDTALVPEQEPTPADITVPGVAAEEDPDQTGDFVVIDPETGLDTDDIEDPSDDADDTDPTDDTETDADKADD